MPTPADPIITLAEVKPFLRMDSTDSDEKVTEFIAAASQMIVNRIGQVAGSPTVDEWHDGGTERIVLRNQGPIQSVTSVTENYGSVTYTLSQVTLDVSSTGNSFTYTVDLDEGLIVRRAAGVAICFTPGVRNVHVTYVAGYATTPADIKHACQLLVKHLWDTQRGSKPGAGPMSEQIPPRVDEILSRYTIPGIG